MLKKFLNFHSGPMVFALILSFFLLSASAPVSAYPLYAQQGYENPREVTGRIVCANCHLAQKPVELKFLKLFFQILYLKL